MRVNRSKIEPPPIDPTTLRRPRLELLISGLLQTHRVVVVTATAGAGKTTAIRQMLEGEARPSAWLSLQGADAQPGRLVTYLAAAMSEIDGGLLKIVESALASGLVPNDAAELLASEVPDLSRVLVLDNAEVLAARPAAMDLITSFAQALPKSAGLLISSRTSLSLSFNAPNSPLRVGSVDEKDLAFTVPEAESALLRAGENDIDAEVAVRLTGGWVAGVLFEAWRLEAHVAGLGGEADPLHGYLATEVLGRLEDSARDFLVLTSVLDQVSVEQARGLQIPNAAATMDSLRRVRLPAVWSQDGRTFRCHPRFQEYLLELLERRPDEEVRTIRLAHARQLIASGRLEDAVEAFIAASALDEAKEAAERTIVDVVVRSDVSVAERWLITLVEPDTLPAAAFHEAELLLALATEDYGRGADACDRMMSQASGRAILATSARAVALTAWLYLHRGRLDAIRDVLALGGEGPELDIVRYAVALIEEESAAASGRPPTLTRSPFDALAMRTHFDLGRLELLLEVEELSPWASRAAAPWRVSALLATGRLDQCVALAEELGRNGQHGVWLAEVVEPQLMAERGDVSGALARLHAGRSRIVESGSIYRLITSLLSEAELRLRHKTDLSAARGVLVEVERHAASHDFANFREQLSMLTGLKFALEGANSLAIPLLEDSVASMERGRRVLWLPAAAVYLAEARWRVGDLDGADDAASRALAGAAAQGTNHGLLRALTLFPDVLSRRLDSEPTSDSEWNRVGRSLATITGHPVGVAQGALRLVEFGRLAATLDGETVPLRLRKAFELLAVLAEAGPEGVPRKRLLHQLFRESGERTASNYLRQATMKLRQALPEILPSSTDGVLRLSEDTSISSEFSDVALLRRQAASGRGLARLHSLTGAIGILDRGEYLPGCTSPWATDRRTDLELQHIALRADAAEVAFEVGQTSVAESLAEQVLAADPFRETMWQVRMRCASAVGNNDAIVSMFRGCEAAMASLGTNPSASTLTLFNNIRR